MPIAWSCCREPEEHGAFLQSGLLELAEHQPDMQPPRRFGCPVCIAQGHEGAVRPATSAEAARFAANKGE